MTPPLDPTRQLFASVVRAYYAAVGATVAQRTAEAERASAELARLIDESRRILWPPVPWRELSTHIRNMQGGSAGEREALEALRLLREKGMRPWYGWTAPVGLAHEDPARSETWGPRSPAEVDWTGFHT